MPEQDDWRYEFHNGERAFSASEFIIAAYQQLGLFDGFEINASEFTPKDIYQLDIFDKNYEKPEDCAEADNHLHYC